jgi:rubredoxin
MPKCPHCGFAADSVTEFVYKVGVGKEGHDVQGESLSTYLVCPDCDALLGSPMSPTEL